jgi:hypothetical protein
MFIEERPMQNDLSPDTAYMTNLAVCAAALELGGAALLQVAGDETMSNQVGGETQQLLDFQELLSARLGAQYNL